MLQRGRSDAGYGVTVRRGAACIRVGAGCDNWGEGMSFTRRELVSGLALGALGGTVGRAGAAPQVTAKQTMCAGAVGGVRYIKNVAEARKDGESLRGRVVGVAPGG